MEGRVCKEGKEGFSGREVREGGKEGTRSVMEFPSKEGMNDSTGMMKALYLKRRKEGRKEGRKEKKGRNEEGEGRNEEREGSKERKEGSEGRKWSEERKERDEGGK